MNPFYDLYITCFPEDSPADAKHLFTSVFSKATLVAEQQSNRPIAMLYLMDCELVDGENRYPVYYLYAACTHPDYRKQGWMRHLLERAKETARQNDKKAIFLKPAQPSLFHFYQKSNFTPYFSVGKWCGAAQNFTNLCQKAGLSFDSFFPSCSSEEWLSFRRRLLSESGCRYVDYPTDLFLGATADCHFIGNHTLGVAYEIRENLLFVKEALCRSGKERELLSLVRLLLTQSKCSLLELRLPTPLSAHLPVEFTISPEPFSVLWTTEDIPQSAALVPYHGFAFD